MAAVISSVVDVGTTISNNIVTIGSSLNTNVPTIVNNALDVTIIATQNGMMLTRGTLAVGVETVGVLKGWGITKVSLVGGTSAYIGLNAMIGVDRLLYHGPGWIQKYRINFTDSGERIVQDATLLASNLVVDGINNAYAGFQKRNPISPALKEDIKNVKNMLGGSAL